MLSSWSAFILLWCTVAPWIHHCYSAWVLILCVCSESPRCHQGRGAGAAPVEWRGGDSGAPWCSMRWLRTCAWAPRGSESSPYHSLQSTSSSYCTSESNQWRSCRWSRRRSAQRFSACTYLGTPGAETCLAPHLKLWLAKGAPPGVKPPGFRVDLTGICQFGPLCFPLMGRRCWAALTGIPKVRHTSLHRSTSPLLFSRLCRPCEPHPNDQTSALHTSVAQALYDAWRSTAAPWGALCQVAGSGLRQRRRERWLFGGASLRVSSAPGRLLCFPPQKCCRREGACWWGSTAATWGAASPASLWCIRCSPPEPVRTLLQPESRTSRWSGPLSATNSGETQLCLHLTLLFLFKLKECKHQRKHMKSCFFLLLLLFFLFTFFKQVRSLRLT